MSTTRHEDLVQLLLDDHSAIAELLGRAPSVSDRAEYFCEVVQTLVAHEVAEEEIVYPAFRRHGGSAVIADARLGEQAEAEKLLAKMEKLDPTDAEFAQAMARLATAAAEHARAEETTVFTWMESNMDTDDLRRLGEVYTAAKAVAPTHPHPHAPDTPPGNLVVGPVVALADRLRDTIKRATARS